MRKEFTAWLEQYTVGHEKTVVLTGDLGYAALESVRDKLGPRFVNAGVSEQNMVSVAAALATEGLVPFCYSIAPFAVFRPAEQIRLDVCIHNLNVKVVGNGGGYGYGIMGATHHAIEDIAVLSSFPFMRCFVPVIGADVETTANAMMAYEGPSYLRLNMGTLPKGFSLSTPFAPMREVRSEARGAAAPVATVVALGPMIVNALGHAEGARVDHFVVSQLPLPHLPDAFKKSVAASKHLIILEEHVERGGLAEHLALMLLKAGLSPKVTTRSAQGYPSKRYGSQAWHQKESSLDPASIQALLTEALLQTP